MTALPPSRRPLFAAFALVATLVATVAGCDRNDAATPEQVRATVQRLLPPGAKDRAGWAADIQTAFTALELPPTPEHLCSAIAVAEQESNFSADPAVPGLGRIAKQEIEARAERKHVPVFLVRAAMQLNSPDGRTWDQRIAEVHTEKELSDLYEELISRVPMGGKLLAAANPVHTGGPMQVSIEFAEAHVRDHRYPYAIDGSIRHEVFSRRGGLYFGIAHLLDYPTDYPKPIFRFADFNAGRYASRNAAFQKAVSLLTRTPLDFDGDLVRYRRGEDGETGSATETAVLALADRLSMTPDAIRGALRRAHDASFEDTDLYRRVFALADKQNRKPLPRAMLPDIRLHSPKITRQLTTGWFANRVDQRFQRCMARSRRR